jgi:hypothetical protein
MLFPHPADAWKFLQITAAAFLVHFILDFHRLDASDYPASRNLPPIGSHFKL